MALLGGGAIGVKLPSHIWITEEIKVIRIRGSIMARPNSKELNL